MPDLSYRQQKIQEKRKQTPFRDFVMEICSWKNFIFYRNAIWIGKYPQAKGREMHLFSFDTYQEKDVNSVELFLDYSTNQPFLEQVSHLYHSYPYPLVNHYGLQENAERGDEVRWAKNVYLSVVVGDNAENILYTFKGESNVKNVLHSVNITQNCENIYNSKTVRWSYNIFYSRFIYNSANIRFSDNMLWCTECIQCQHLENKSYCINNISYSREEYFAQKQEILKKKSAFDTFFSAVSSQWNIRISDKVSGVSLYNCHNVENAYEVANLRNSRNVVYTDGGNDSSDCYDVIDSAVDTTHHLYGIMGQSFGDHVYCSWNIVESSHIYYSLKLQHCSFCLWCVGLTNKSFCILNKQYTKEERHEKVNQIFEQMEKDWTLWEFFPARMNPFYFNDTIAYFLDPSFTKEEVEKAGYLRRDEPIKVDIPADLEQVHVRDLDQYEGYDEDGKRHINEEILKKVIIDDQGNARRIVNMEYVFLMKYGLPLPRKHRLERMKENFRIG